MLTSQTEIYDIPIKFNDSNVNPAKYLGTLNTRKVWKVI